MSPSAQWIRHVGRHRDGRPAAAGPVAWTEPMLRRAVHRLYEQAVRRSELDDGYRIVDEEGCERVVDEIVRLGLQPEVLGALRKRTDPEEAIVDLCTRYAFAQVMAEGRAAYELDPLSRSLVQHALDTIYQRAAQVAERVGEDPLDEDPGLLISLCRCLSRYLPRKPMRAHITWKLSHYEGAVSRAVRQIEHLVTRPEVTEAFVAHVLQTALPDAFKAQLLQLARGGGRGGLNYEAAIRFFALPATEAWVKAYAGTVQTARTLYDEDAYEGIPWRGRRRLPRGRRQGYLDAALASLERGEAASLDTEDYDLHDLVDDPDAPAWSLPSLAAVA